MKMFQIYFLNGTLVTLEQSADLLSSLTPDLIHADLYSQGGSAFAAPSHFACTCVT